MKKILLVNATRYFFDEGENILDRKDFQVFRAANCVRALQIHREEKVDLIVTDLEMPEMSGDVLCRRVREEAEARIVSFILICHDTHAEIQRAKLCGANIWLTKPFTAQTLLEQVEKMLAISVRRGYRVLLRAKVTGSRDDTTFFCTSQNISATGMLIESDKVLVRGDVLNCSFYLPDSTHIVSSSEIVRSEVQPDGKHVYGVRFIDLSQLQRKSIESFIEESVATK